MHGTQYATKRSILCRGAFCGPTLRVAQAGLSHFCRTYHIVGNLMSQLTCIYGILPRARAVYQDQTM